MIIDTKYSIGDDVWYMHNGIPCCAQIERIKIEVSAFGGIERRYSLINDELSERELFDSKDELINNNK